MTRIRFVVGAIVLVAVAACKQAENGAVLQILDSPQEELDCTLSATPTAFQSTGTYDPTGVSQYLLNLYLTNLANDRQNPAVLPGSPDIKPSSNDALVVGYDMCFYRGDDPSVIVYNPNGNNVPKSCDDVAGNQREFVTSTGTVTSNGGFLSTSIRILDTFALQTLFGIGFDPATLANRFAFDENPDDPTNLAARDPAWGNFPASVSARVNVQVRARATTQVGRTIRSNWFIFPVEVCPFCVRNDACPTRRITCPDGSTGEMGFDFTDTSCADRASGAPYTCQTVDTCGT